MTGFRWSYRRRSASEFEALLWFRGAIVARLCRTDRARDLWQWRPEGGCRTWGRR